MIKLKTDAERDPMYIEIIPSLKLIDNANREWLICMFHMRHLFARKGNWTLVGL